jgi:enoyl-CoA hydratase/carnithine racemase
MPLIQYENLSPFIGAVKFNDPENLNAMGEKMADEFFQALARIRQEGTLRALIVTGEGKAFSAGGHLAMLEAKRALSGEENRRRMLDFYHAFLSVRELEIPVIAAVNGSAIGAGLCVAIACDIRIAGVGAKLGFTFAKLGLHPGMGATYLLPSVVGIAAASELLLTGRVIDAEEAFRIGLISKIVPTERLLQSAKEVAEEIASCGPEAIRQLLRTLRNRPSSLEDALDREAICQSVNYSSPEFAEGLAATREKRKPKF